MKTTLLRNMFYVVLACTGVPILKGMETSPYSLTNTGKIAFVATILGHMKREIVPTQTWRIYANPHEISITVDHDSKRLFVTFSPPSEHTHVKVSESPQDKSLCAIVNETDALLLIEQESSPQTSARIRPQTAPANSFRYQQ